jgi:hypothetical protein
LRKILPHCDVLLVATTQQKYRSARVAEELAAAAAGAKLVFVQTHADCEDDIRADWHRLLAERHEVGHIFLIDSLAALNDAKQNLQPRGEFAGLVDLLRRQLAGAAATRIRRANFLDLLSETLTRCRHRLDEKLPAVEQVQNAIAEERGKLSSLLARQMNAELTRRRCLHAGRAGTLFGGRSTRAVKRRPCCFCRHMSPREPGLRSSVRSKSRDQRL